MENITHFFGRFHPLIVHLPIGILLMAGILQIIALKSKKYANALDPAIGLTLLWGGISSIGAVGIGWLLSFQGGYDDNTLFWHKWLGIVVTIIAFIGWLIRVGKINMKNSFFYMVLSAIIVLVSVTGHLGGSLTHGEDYLLVYSPDIIKKMAGVETGNKNNDLAEMHPDSIMVYPHIIQPMLDAKCVSCHSSSKRRGGLVLSSYSDFMAGGENGYNVDTKSPMESDFLSRVTLPKGHKKFMPPKGTPLSFAEIKIVEWWMKSGADSTMRFSSAENIDKELIRALIRDYKLDYNPKPYYEKVKVDSIPKENLETLKENNFTIDFMGEFNNMISVRYRGDSITRNQIDKLLLVKEQITWLNLSNSKLTDGLLDIMSNFPNLTRINLHSNPLTDAGLKSLKSAKHLSSLNLYNTNITNSGLDEVLQIESLLKLYVWKTDITEEYIEEVSKKQERVDIIAKLN
jgi:uncharacterized membrane protein